MGAEERGMRSRPRGRRRDHKHLEEACTTCATESSKVARDNWAASRRRDDQRAERGTENSGRRARVRASEKTQRRTEDHRRERARRPQARLGFRVQRVWEGREGPTSPNLPSTAFPDFQGEVFDRRPRQRQSYVCAQWIC